MHTVDPGGDNSKATMGIKLTDAHTSHTCALQLRGYLTEPLLEQISHLVELQRYLENLSFMQTPPIKKDIILEQVN